ncbi:semaphorin-7A-like [Sparus aurata]|uniref:Semaphorin-7A-like n=1 Tax=Sparus aurata TaxID=8175 RepID=A0A671XXY8_SPAAU|nr:semaphorin-7A-like [Sparus aurata]
MILFTVCLLFSCYSIWTEANSTHLARVIFSDTETVRRLPFPVHGPIRMLLGGEPDTVTAVGQTHLFSVDFQNPLQPPVEKTVLWQRCGYNPKDCNYKISVVHETNKTNEVFVCGTDGASTVCCHMNLSEQSPMCNHLNHLRISNFAIEEGEPSAIVETEGGADLYVTHSGSQENVGIYKFGEHRVKPAIHEEEQHYVGLVLSRQKDNPLQDKVYGFYKEKNRDKGLDSEMWVPYVTRVCMADKGGHKNALQFIWTSQLNARLFCGDADSRKHFSELVDVAAVHAERWQDTRVYALFRNEWSVSAVCVYSMEDIDHIFQTSPFQGDERNRSRACVEDSTKIHTTTLNAISPITRMQKWVRPVKNSGPLVFSHHRYTHIFVDSSPNKGGDDYPVLFLSLHNGGIHKVIRNMSQAFVIAEYQPFNHTDQVLSILLHSSAKRLYVNSQSELVQLNVANCAKYGDKCEDCVLARDPYCGWKDGHCTSETDGSLQDVAGGNYSICLSASNDQPRPGRADKYTADRHADKDVGVITVPHHSKYFLRCPVSSHHAQYTWHHPEGSTPCSSREKHCLHLIDSMGPEQEGTYKCVSDEMGHRKDLAVYRLQQGNRAVGPSSSALVWVCVMAVLIKTFFC